MAELKKLEAGTVCWVDLLTPDLARARAFYGALFGWSFSGSSDPTATRYSMAQVDGLNVAGLGTMPAHSSLPSMWTVYFAAENADETAHKVEKAGGKIVAEPTNVLDEGRTARFSDPTSAIFGVWEGRKHRGAELVDEPSTMTWHEVYTRDAAVARPFYTRVLGLEARYLESPSMKYWTLHRGPRTVCGLMQMGPQDPKGAQSHWHTYFAVSDVDATVDQLGLLGGREIAPPFDTPYGRVAVAADPFGAQFCVVRSPKS